jgi:CO/xanthine dehydrogenase FAD-binding subunit
LASFKIQHVATVGGNLCLALPAGTLAPAMVVLEAQYDILPLNNSPYTVSALDFQTGARQTLLQPGDVLRHIRIPAASLSWQVGYRRLCMASAGIALSIVVAAYDPTTGRVRVGLGAAVDYPRLLEFPSVPTPDELAVAFETQVPASDWIEDGVASSEYRRHVTQVLVARSLQDALSGR